MSAWFLNALRSVGPMGLAIPAQSLSLSPLDRLCLNNGIPGIRMRGQCAVFMPFISGWHRRKLQRRKNGRRADDYLMLPTAGQRTVLGTTKSGLRIEVLRARNEASRGDGYPGFLIVAAEMPGRTIVIHYLLGGNAT